MDVGNSDVRSSLLPQQDGGPRGSRMQKLRTTRERNMGVSRSLKEFHGSGQSDVSDLRATARGARDIMKADRYEKSAAPTQRSWLRSMFRTRSKSKQALIYQNVIGFLITVNVGFFLLSTYPNLKAQYGYHFDSVEAITSYIFLVDYCFRLVTVVEQKCYASKGPIMGRLKWMCSFEGLLDAMATFPYFLDKYAFSEDRFPSFTWVRVFRVFVIFRANKYARAVSTVSRVLFVNREILAVSTFMVMFMLLFTSALIWAAADEDLAKANYITSVPSAMYLALQMLTGQGGPDGDLTTEMEYVCSVTAFLSVPFFAVPAAMLTWGFEGEAERLAERECCRYQRKKLYGNDVNSAITSSSSSESDVMEQYLQRWGGPDAQEEIEEEAMQWFEKPSVAKLSAPDLFRKAIHRAQRLRFEESQGRMRGSLKHDALLLIEQCTHRDPDEDESDIPSRLVAFRDLVHHNLSQIEGKAEEEEKEPTLAEVMAELKQLRAEVASLKR